MFCDGFGHFRRWGVAKRRHFAGAAIALGTVLASGCAGIGGLTVDSPAETKREAVAARAQARWERLIKLDVAGAYEYLSPATRATMPLDLYRAKHKLGLYKAVKVDGVDCGTDTCTVRLSLTYDYKSFKGITTPLTEQWIITQGQAWYVERG